MPNKEILLGKITNEIEKDRPMDQKHKEEIKRVG